MKVLNIILRLCKRAHNSPTPPATKRLFESYTAGFYDINDSRISISVQRDAEAQCLWLRIQREGLDLATLPFETDNDLYTFLSRAQEAFENVCHP